MKKMMLAVTTVLLITVFGSGCVTVRSAQTVLPVVEKPAPKVDPPEAARPEENPQLTLVMHSMDYPDAFVEQVVTFEAKGKPAMPSELYNFVGSVEVKPVGDRILYHKIMVKIGTVSGKTQTVEESALVTLLPSANPSLNLKDPLFFTASTSSVTGNVAMMSVTHFGLTNLVQRVIEWRAGRAVGGVCSEPNHNLDMTNQYLLNHVDMAASALSDSQLDLAPT